MDQILSFTTIFNGLANCLINKVEIGPAFNPEEQEPPPKLTTYNAIWDTGATNTIITERVANDCGITPTGVTRLETVSGTDSGYTYFISILLPNKLGIPNIKVAEGNLKNPIDLLIGMDIINKGDFAVNNIGNRTSFSFRMPSLERVDYTKSSQNAPVSPKDRKNQPCPCGSGKLYRDCHGKGQYRKRRKKRN